MEEQGGCGCLMCLFSLIPRKIHGFFFWFLTNVCQLLPADYVEEFLWFQTFENFKFSKIWEIPNFRYFKIKLNSFKNSKIEIFWKKIQQLKKQKIKKKFEDRDFKKLRSFKELRIQSKTSNL